ncbi:MAG: carbohydrate kinase family protein [Actinomycetota bacterium]|nr:carbohydrate kinase family protein [Actinomycetota bacterium]
MADVICLGILVVDVLAWPVDAMPQRGSLALIDGATPRAGGCALNTATTLARFDLDVTVAGVVGADALGGYLLETITQRGLDSRIARSVQHPTSTSVVLVASDGERTFLHSPGANACLTEDTFDVDTLASAKAVHLGGSLLMPGLDGEPAARLLEQLRARGVHTSIDSAYDADGRWHRFLPMLAHTDLATVGWAEGQHITGEREPDRIANALHRHGCREVAVKMGPEGSYVSGAGHRGHHAAFPVTAVDGTGAGDAFTAGLLYGRLAGWPLSDATRLATAAGALATTAIGAVEGVGDLSQAIALAGLDIDSGGASSTGAAQHRRCRGSGW